MDSNKQIPEHIKRVITEHSDLVDKIVKLGNLQERIDVAIGDKK